jgi:hypothetical protein
LLPLKSELLNTDYDQDGRAQFLGLEQVSLEIGVTVRREGKAGVKVCVAELRGSAARDNVHRMTVNLVPQLTRDERLQLYRARHPQRLVDLENIALESIQAKGHMLR